MARRIAVLLFSLLMVLSSAAWAEVLYVHDELRLGVRPQANSSDTPLTVVTTGARLEVLGRAGNFVQVRTASGVEGWVNAAYLSEDKPARLILEELEAEREALLTRLADLQMQLEGSQEQVLLLGQRIESMADNEAELQQQNARYRAELALDEKDLSWLYQALGGIFLFLLGIYLGVKWYRHSISERMGGLEI